ncbi:flippase-like domain-containing protein, partial [Myxococcota bacterium]|nr:flippase-like domain-containing protein [Myxococcota bacterium]
SLPFVVSGALLTWVLSGVNLRGVLHHVTPTIALWLAPTLIVFLIVSLTLEAICLVWVISASHPFRNWVVAARIKAASYPLGLVNYALGAGATAVLLRRRAQMTLTEAAGAIFVIGLFDLGALIACVLGGMAWLGTPDMGLRAGLIVLLGLLALGGLGALRTPISMGPIDRLRELEIFHDARTLPLSTLLKVGGVRLVFVCIFIMVVGVTLKAFGVDVPLADLTVNTSILLLVSTLPIAVAGIGTGQVVFVALFDSYANAETLIAASLTLSFGMIITRAVVGLAFAREFTAEALAAQTEEQP